MATAEELADYYARLNFEYGGDALPGTETPKLTPDLTNTAEGIAWQNMEVYGTPAPAPAPAPTRAPTRAPAPAPQPKPKPVDKLSAQELAENYSWAYALLRAVPELWSLFQQAFKDPKGQWTPQKFAAKAKNTKFYQTHSTSWIEAETERLTHPGQWDSGIRASTASVQATAAQIGATLSPAILARIAETNYRLKYNPEQLRSALVQYIVVKNGALAGEAGTNAQNLRELARANGVSYNGDWFNNAARSIIGGTRSFQDFENDIRNQAASAFPTYAEQIRAGQNVKDIASPYINSMSRILEINPDGIDLNDNSIRQALSGINPKDGKPAAKSLWEFERDIRKDPRWNNTNNARESASSLALGVLRDWGFNG